MDFIKRIARVLVSMRRKLGRLSLVREYFGCSTVIDR